MFWPWKLILVLNPIDMRDRDLILIISFVMHFAGIEGHSFLWLEKFPIAIHSWLTIKIVRTNLSLFLSGEFNSLLGGSWWHCSHAAGFHSTPTTTFLPIKNRLCHRLESLDCHHVLVCFCDFHLLIHSFCEFILVLCVFISHCLPKTIVLLTFLR